MNNIVLNGDCLNLLDSIPNESVDAVIVDPPFYVMTNDDIAFEDRSDIIQKVDFDQFVSYDHFVQFTEQWVQKVSAKMKPDSSFYSFFAVQYITDLLRICEKHGLKYHGIIVWHKVNPAPKIRKRGYLSSTEVILVATKGNYTFNFGHQNDMHNFIETSICMGKERIRRKTKDAKGKYPSVHATQKPEILIEKLMTDCSNANDVILDCFMGVGTTCAVAKKLGRRYIGIERDAEYYQYAVERINKTKKKVLSKGSILNFV